MLILYIGVGTVQTWGGDGTRKAEGGGEQSKPKLTTGGDDFETPPANF